VKWNQLNIIFYLTVIFLYPNYGFSQGDSLSFVYFGSDNSKVTDLGQLELAKDGRVWIGSWGQGLFIFDGYDFKHFIHNPDSDIDLKSNYVVGLYENKNNEILVGTTKNLLSIAPPYLESSIIKYKDSEDNPIDFSRSEAIIEIDDILWVGTSNGLLKCSYIDGHCKRFKTAEISSPKAYFDNYFYKIIKDPLEDKLWITSAYGLKFFDMKTKLIKQVNTPDGYHDMGKNFKQHKMWDMVMDDHHRLWFAARTSGGIYCFDIDKNNWINYRNNTKANDPSYGNRITSLTYINDSTVYFSNLLGLGKIDFHTSTLKQLPWYDIDKGGWVKKMKIDLNGILWMTGVNSIVRTKYPVIKRHIQKRVPEILSVSLNDTKSSYWNWNRDTVPYSLNSFGIDIGVINPINKDSVWYKWKKNNNILWSKSSKSRYIDLTDSGFGNNHVSFMASYDNKNWIAGKEFKFFHKRPFYLEMKFITFVLALLSLMIVSLSWYLKILKKRKIKEIRSYELHLAHMEMKSLRAQLNPHFLFNSLNSISSYIYKNKSEFATEYLAKFAKLMRLILRFSEEKLIALSQELDVVKLYLNLEQMRFKDKFDFEIKIGDNIDIDTVFIPPLLLQPFLENSVWHGILHQEKKGIIQITIIHKNELTLIQIIDNGRGREASIKSKSPTSEKKSYGLNISQNRLRLINIVHNTKASAEIFDLKDKTGNPTGTKVIIKIPIFNKKDYESNNYR